MKKASYPWHHIIFSVLYLYIQSSAWNCAWWFQLRASAWVVWHEKFFTFCSEDVALVLWMHCILSFAQWNGSLLPIIFFSECTLFFNLELVTSFPNLHRFIKCTVVHWQPTAYTFFIHLTLVQAFLDLGELLITSDAGAALDAFKTVRASCVSPFSGLSTLFS